MLEAIQKSRKPVTFESLNYTPHPKQVNFHDAVQAHNYVLFNGGRGSGKTTAGAIEAVMQSLVYDVGARGIVVAPTYGMLKDATMHEFFRWLPREYITNWNKTDKVLELTNRSQVAFRSADNPDTLRGPNRAWAWFDEPRNIRTREVFDIVTAQLRPTRKLWLTTTPSGIFHWMYELFIENPLPDSEVITVRTAENPHVPPDFDALLRTQYTGMFAAQELDAEWVSFEGRIYDNFSLTENVTEDAEYNPNLPITWGVDDGYATGEGQGKASYHPRVILLGQETPIGGVNIFASYYKSGELTERSISEVLSWPYNRPGVAYVDSSAVELKARLWELSIQTVGGTHKVTEGIKNLRRLICDGNNQRLLKIHPRNKELIRELQLYRYDDAAKVATVGEPKPLKVDDHGPDALRYMTWHLRYGH